MTKEVVEFPFHGPSGAEQQYYCMQADLSPISSVAEKNTTGGKRRSLKKVLFGRDSEGEEDFHHRGLESA